MPAEGSGPVASMRAASEVRASEARASEARVSAGVGPVWAGAAQAWAGAARAWAGAARAWAGAAPASVGAAQDGPLSVPAGDGAEVGVVGVVGAVGAGVLPDWVSPARPMRRPHATSPSSCGTDGGTCGAGPGSASRPLTVA